MHKQIFGGPKRSEYKELMGMRALGRRLICIGKFMHSKLVPTNVAATITGKHDNSFSNDDNRC